MSLRALAGFRTSEECVAFEGGPPFSRTEIAGNPQEASVWVFEEFRKNR